MFTISPVSILYTNVKNKILYLKVLHLFTINQAVVYSTIATDGNLKKKSPKYKEFNSLFAVSGNCWNPDKFINLIV